MSSENKTNAASTVQSQRQKNLPIARNKDVEFSSEAADNEDMAAQNRATAANKRQNSANTTNK
jgi:hypothetical protein